MYSIADGISPVDLGLACIVCIAYIVGKVWIHYKVGDTQTKETETNTKNN